MAGPAAAVAPRRFRRRVLGLLLGVGVLPILIVGGAALAVTSQLLSISLAPLSDALDAVDRERAAAPAAADPAVTAALDAARLELAQAELARRSLARLAPVAVVVGLAIVGVLVVVGSAAFSRGLARPLEELASGMGRLAGGDLDHRLPARGGAPADEVAYLVAAFNRMGDELAVQRARLKVSEELAAWQGVARDLAHELRNPLTAMKMALGRIGHALEQGGAGATAGEVAVAASAPIRESVELLREEIEVLIRLTRSFADFAKLPEPAPRPLDPGALVEEVCAVYRASTPLAIEVTAGGLPTIDGDPDQLRRVIGNLVKNAIEASAIAATDAARSIAVSARVERLAAGRRRLVVEVADRGVGVPAPLAGGALTRSLGSTKPGGSGLGLPIAHKIAHAHGGALSLEPRAGGGAVARLVLPLPASDAAEAA